MFKVKLIDVVNAAVVLKALCCEPLTVGTSFRAAKLNRAVQAEFEVYDEQRIKLLNEYGTANAETGRYDIPEEKIEAFNAAYSELVSQEVEINADKVNLSGEDIRLTPNDAAAIENFVEI